MSRRQSQRSIDPYARLAQDLERRITGFERRHDAAALPSASDGWPRSIGALRTAVAEASRQGAWRILEEVAAEIESLEETGRALRDARQRDAGRGRRSANATAGGR